jgi:Calcineurin-like phosphoesterase
MKPARLIGLSGLSLSLFGCASAQQPPDSWRFAVGGDSRNCGDVVMPAVAAGARAEGARFYWHLGDFRYISNFDQDMVAARRASSGGAAMTIAEYQKTAWDDFIANQLSPFGEIPVFLGIGNHELYAPKSRAEYLSQFADWIAAESITRQRLADDPRDHRLKTYYHWVERGVDFVNLDNASTDQFDDEQLKWFERVLARDGANPAIRTIVVGMHACLPDSIAASHSMSDWALGEQSGRRVYEDLLKARAGGKRVYVLASHSHFFLSDTFATDYWRSHGGVLPGWIIGTTGAIRYVLPPDAGSAGEAKTNVYGLMIGTATSDGEVRFEFHEVREADVPADVVRRFTPELVHDCFAQNRESTSR